MRLVRFERESKVGWGFLEGDRVIDAAPIASGSLEDALVGGIDGLKSLRASCNQEFVLDHVRLLQPLGRPSKMIGLARNYDDHGPGSRPGGAPPTPLLFGMLPSAVIGPGDTIVLPASAPDRVDWEVELGIVIGRAGRHIASNVALDHVAGYTIVNDISSRAPEIPADKLFRGKAYDTFKPMGPWITTADELGDASSLSLRLLVNGVTKQDSTTANMIVGVRRLVEFCSSIFTLEPGDVIASGTPGGVGASRNPPEFLMDGDDVVCEIEGIGRLQNRVRREAAIGTSNVRQVPKQTL